MRSGKRGAKYGNFDDVMRLAPGPSPWHFRRDPPKVIGQRGRFEWSDAAEDFPDLKAATGKILLRDTGGHIRLILDFHCYAQQQAEGRLLCWYAIDQDDVPAANGLIHLRIFDVDALPIVEDAAGAFADMGRERHAVWPPVGDIAHVTIPLTLGDGTHRVSFPDALHSIDELLILGHAVRDGRTSNFDDEMHLCIYVVRPAEGTVTVIAQDWFNSAGLDYSYQWVTRIARDPETKRIFGEGVRIRSFVLRPDGRRVEVWRSGGAGEAPPG